MFVTSEVCQYLLLILLQLRVSYTEIKWRLHRGYIQHHGVACLVCHWMWWTQSKYNSPDFKEISLLQELSTCVVHRNPWGALQKIETLMCYWWKYKSVICKNLSMVPMERRLGTLKWVPNLLLSVTGHSRKKKQDKIEVWAGSGMTSCSQGTEGHKVFIYCIWVNVFIHRYLFIASESRTLGEG